ncbi:peptidase C15 [Rhabdaerophilum sp. SD176]|uniref:pyroglutamyl-peptidase I family protein n=1 Tax=Rhabdaerophilum sp. SD176 TaxID=2983548 RepID=UPI0024DF3AEF|nr:peptidase C15 [Rhabdaerophilum sp. SD176]
MKKARPLRALVTGFGPFPGVPHNPSGVIAEAVTRSGRWARLGWQVEGVPFPTDYRVVLGWIKAFASAPPAFVIMLGVAARSQRLRVEMVARNRVSATARDVSGRKVNRRLLEPGAETIRPGRHAGAALVRDLRRAGVPARTSLDAGRYVCNAAYWWMLGAMPRETRVVFVHIPLPGKAGQRRHEPRPTLPAMIRAITALVGAEIGRARR